MIKKKENGKRVNSSFPPRGIRKFGLPKSLVGASRPPLIPATTKNTQMRIAIIVSTLSIWFLRHNIPIMMPFLSQAHCRRALVSPSGIVPAHYPAFPDNPPIRWTGKPDNRPCRRACHVPPTEGDTGCQEQITGSITKPISRKASIAAFQENPRPWYSHHHQGAPCNSRGQFAVRPGPPPGGRRLRYS